jgi:tetratricopeptide (TPR) repeat protein
MEEMKALFDQGVKWLHHRDFEQAIALFDQVLQLDPNYTEAWNCRGLAFGHLKQYPECMESFDRAIDIQPSNSQALLNKGIALGEWGKHEEASANFDRMLLYYPHSSVYRSTQLLRSRSRIQPRLLQSLRQ